MWIIKNKYGQYYTGSGTWTNNRKGAHRYESYNLASIIVKHILEDCTIESA